MKRLALCVALAALGGCAVTDTLPPQDDYSSYENSVVLNSFADLNFQALNIYDQPVEIERVLNVRSQVLNFEGNQSAALAWKLPGYGAYRFKVKSLIQRAEFGDSATAFMPEVVILDKDFAAVKRITSEQALLTIDVGLFLKVSDYAE